MIGDASPMKEFGIAGVLVHDPIGNRRTIASAGARQIEYEIGSLVEPVLTPNGLNIVAI